MPTVPCNTYAGSGINQSLQLSFFSDYCRTCNGSGEGHSLWGRERFIRAVLEEGRRYIEEADAYAEEGYALEEGKRGILFANWNAETRWDSVTRTSIVTDDFMPRFGKIVEKAGYECEWSDEWSTCCACRKAFRLSGDSNGWQPSYAEVNEEYLCILCIREDLETFIEDRSGTLRGISIPIGDEALEALGWARVNTESEFESGWHPGQTDDPAQIGKRLRAGGITEFLLVLDGVSRLQFDFSVWVKSKEVGDVRTFLATGEVTLRMLARRARDRKEIR